MKQPIRTFRAIAGFATVLLVSVAWAQDNTTQGANRTMTADSTFASKAGQGGMAEVQLGNLAKIHAENPAVKTFAQQMIDDHTKAGDELKQIAAAKHITIPASMNSKDQATFDRLSRLNGAAFDREYMKDMVADHHADIAEFQHESTRGTDPELKAFATKTLATLQQHLKMAESTEAGLKAAK